MEPTDVTFKEAAQFATSAPRLPDHLGYRKRVYVDRKLKESTPIPAPMREVLERILT